MTVVHPLTSITCYVSFTLGKTLFELPTRQVHNGTRTSNLSQQQRKQFWSKMIFEQQNQKNFPKKKFPEKNFFPEKI